MTACTYTKFLTSVHFRVLDIPVNVYCTDLQSDRLHRRRGDSYTFCHPTCIVEKEVGRRVVREGRRMVREGRRVVREGGREGEGGMNR